MRTSYVAALLVATSLLVSNVATASGGPALQTPASRPRPASTSMAAPMARSTIVEHSESGEAFNAASASVSHAAAHEPTAAHTVPAPPTGKNAATAARGVRSAGPRSPRPLSERPAKAVMRAYEMSARSIVRKVDAAKESETRVKDALHAVDYNGSEKEVYKGVFKRPAYAFQEGVIERVGAILAEDPRTAGLMNPEYFAAGETPFERSGGLREVIWKGIEVVAQEHPDVTRARGQMQALSNGAIPSSRARSAIGSITPRSSS